MTEEANGPGPRQAMRPGLLVVGTPIGNLGDFSERGRAALRNADAIICEDSRRSGRLLQQLGLPKRPFLIANEHTESRVLGQIVVRIQAGETLALITDAGMPAVSDPGQRLVQGVIEAGCSVEVVPGPTALVSALVLSGLSTSRFVFEGFLARKGKERASQLAALADEVRTVVFYESPKRIRATLDDLARVCGPDRPIALGRELTKLHEEMVRGSIAEVVAHFAATDPRGEFVIVLAGRPPNPEATDKQIGHLLAQELGAGVSKRDAVHAVSMTTGAGKNRVYRLATETLSLETASPDALPPVPLPSERQGGI